MFLQEDFILGLCVFTVDVLMNVILSCCSCLALLHLYEYRVPQH